MSAASSLQPPASGLLLLRTRFGPAARRERRAALRALGRALPARPADVRAVHDVLLALCAFPDDRATHDAALERLQQVAEIAARLGARLHDSGIRGTSLTCAFSSTLASWLAERFGDAVALDWDAIGDGAAIDDLLPHLVAPAERDGLLDDAVDTRTWLERVGGAAGPLRWLLDRTAAMPATPAIRDELYDRAGVAVRWSLDAPEASLSFGRLPDAPIHGVPADLPRRASVRDAVRTAPNDLRPLRRAEAVATLDAMRATLALRRRETDPVTYGAPDEVWRATLDHGFEIAIVGMTPERRLPIESYLGFVAARNGVPIAYGGAWGFCGRGEIGVNVFEPFRGLGSAALFAQVCRAYRHLLALDRLEVAPYQFGAGNPEGIRSGAYWFYDHLGFRSTDPRLLAAAEAERVRLAGTKGARTPPALLRRLARAPVALDLDADAPPRAPFSSVPVSAKLTRALGDADRARASAAAARRLARALDCTAFRGWTDAERAAFTALAPLVAVACPDVASWPARDRAALRRVLRAKGGRHERDHAVALARHARLVDALRTFAAG